MKKNISTQSTWLIHHWISLFLSYTHTHTCEHTCLCVHHAYSLHVNGNPGNILTSPPGTFDDHSQKLRPWSHLFHLPPVHSSRPLMSSMCSVYLNQFRAHSLQPQLLFQSVIMYTHHNPLFCRNPTTCVFSLLLSDAPFTDRAVFSIQGQRISHIFTVIARCWHAGILLSQSANNCSTSSTATDISVQTSATRLLSLTVVEGGKTTIIEDEMATPTSVYCGVLSFGWTFGSKQWLRTKTAQHKPSLLPDREVGGRGDKQRESDGQPECCERGVCCSFMMCEKLILFALHLFQRKCVCVPHCLDRLFPLTQNEIFVGQCSGPTLCFR